MKILLATLLMLLAMPIFYAMLDVAIKKINIKIRQRSKNQSKSIIDI